MKLSVRHKLLLGLLIVFSITYTIAILVIGKTVQKNNQDIIEKDIRDHAANLSLYLRQYLKSSSIEATPEGFNKNVIELGTILSNKFDERIIIYSNKGEFLFDSIYKEGTLDIPVNLQDDLHLAVENKNAYTVINNNNRFSVSSSVPVMIQETNLGVIRYLFDYTYLVNSSKNLFRYIHIAILLILVSLFIFIIILSRKITKPIIHLSKATHMMADGHFDYDLTIKTNDELEELADNFNSMKENIKERIKEVEIERDNLIRLHKHRKLFFDNVTHELKTPLTIISGYTQILTEYDSDDQHFVQRTLGHIKNETDRMHRMILDLLDAAKAESDMNYTFERLDISKIMNDVNKGMIMKAHDRKIEITEDIKMNITIEGDALRIQQALVNIIDNAIKYSGEGTSIQVRLYRDATQCYIVVKDEGIGIDKENLENLFKPFFRVDKSLRESSGLGLYIVKSIVERHGGHIHVDSQKDVGTQVTIKIPLRYDKK